VFEGLARVGKGWESVNVIAAETDGAASFHGGWHNQCPPNYDFMLDSITTIATTLGARQVLTTGHFIPWIDFKDACLISIFSALL
jgi:hypothetical protein